VDRFEFRVRVYNLGPGNPFETGAVIKGRTNGPDLTPANYGANTKSEREERIHTVRRQVSSCLFVSVPDLEELEVVLRCGLPRLHCRLSEWPSLLAEAPDHPDTTGPRAPQHCLLVILTLALEHGDR